MPASRSWARRKSSLGLVSIPPAKAGIYGVQPAELNRLTFCPNVTPTSFKTEADAEDMYDDSPADDSSATLFPPSSTPAPPPRRRRAPPGKRRSLGYIPRPPNAFMLFRADFVKQKHVPNSIETNHSSLSKIIGSCWRSLPVDEKAVWEKRAKVEKAEHKRKYPEYRFRPVHNKKKQGAEAGPATKNNKKMKMDPPPLPSVEAMRTEREGFIAQCLLDGLKGEALKAQVSQWDEIHGWVEGPEGMAALEARAATPKDMFAAPQIRYPPRRSSSVPLPNDFMSFQGGYQPQQYFSHYSDASTSFPHALESSHGLSMDLAGYSVPPSSFPMLPPMNNALRPPSPSPTNFDVGSISRQQRMVIGGRRASSAQAFVNYGRPDDSWPIPNSTWPEMGDWAGANWQTGYTGTGTSPSSTASSLPQPVETDELPEADTSLFQPGFAFGASSFSTQSAHPSLRRLRRSSNAIPSRDTAWNSTPTSSSCSSSFTSSRITFTTPTLYRLPLSIPTLILHSTLPRCLPPLLSLTLLRTLGPLRLQIKRGNFRCMRQNPCTQLLSSRMGTWYTLMISQYLRRSSPWRTFRWTLTARCYRPPSIQPQLSLSSGRVCPLAARSLPLWDSPWTLLTTAMSSFTSTTKRSTMSSSRS
ncbi:hypothetical protein BDP27DRAFT_1257272 [Rhodocollybia butyracea]|uniref:HMG box domain-containing protein n=1 Tax=Rhodocollybia butyracea TaxID=206335 RepID=A0A9P5Q6H5_9AGAR|nr:hypothetical protein BDP27DRAFT_1257272 [Rhodocollybia butyracea]